jgi:hypothetical protein
MKAARFHGPIDISVTVPTYVVRLRFLRVQTVNYAPE